MIDGRESLNPINPLTLTVAVRVQL